MSDTRPIWLSEAEYLDWHKGLGTWALDAQRVFAERWRAAPADATDAAAGGVANYRGFRASDHTDEDRKVAKFVLRMLGMPKEAP